MLVLFSLCCLWSDSGLTWNAQNLRADWSLVCGSILQLCQIIYSSTMSNHLRFYYTCVLCVYTLSFDKPAASHTAVTHAGVLGSLHFKDWDSAKRLAYQLAIILSSKSRRPVKAIAQEYGLKLTESEIWKACEDSDSDWSQVPYAWGKFVQVLLICLYKYKIHALACQPGMQLTCDSLAILWNVSE